MDNHHLTSRSKFLSLLLRHNPGALGLTMDQNGWVSVQDLIQNSKGNRSEFTQDLLEEIVHTDEKQRYVFNEDHTKIRANQGHSLKDVDVELEEKIPPEILFHGTGLQSLGTIQKEGLKKMNRQYVHLSLDEYTALRVGKRHGTPMVLRIKAQRMYQAGFKFFVSKNKVWLTDAVTPEFILDNSLPALQKKYILKEP